MIRGNTHTHTHSQAPTANGMEMRVPLGRTGNSDGWWEERERERRGKSSSRTPRIGCDCARTVEPSRVEPGRRERSIADCMSVCWGVHQCQCWSTAKLPAPEHSLTHCCCCWSKQADECSQPTVVSHRPSHKAAARHCWCTTVTTLQPAKFKGCAVCAPSISCPSAASLGDTHESIFGAPSWS